MKKFTSVLLILAVLMIDTGCATIGEGKAAIRVQRQENRQAMQDLDEEQKLERLRQREENRLALEAERERTQLGKE